MASITLGGNSIHTAGDLPAVGTKAPDFRLTRADLSDANLASFAGKTLVLNIFPSIDTGVCAKSVHAFNKAAAGLDNVAVLCISRDLPFAQKRFCGAEGIEGVVTLAEYRDDSFSHGYHVRMTDGKLAGLMSRAVVVVGTNGVVKYVEQVPEIAQEPNYDAALAAAKA